MQYSNKIHSSYNDNNNVSPFEYYNFKKKSKQYPKIVWSHVFLALRTVSMYLHNHNIVVLTVPRQKLFLHKEFRVCNSMQYVNSYVTK